MTVPNPALNSLNPRLYQIAITPFGTTPPLDHEARRLLDISGDISFPTMFTAQAYGLTTLLAITAHFISAEPPLWLLVTCALPLCLLFWSRLCWQIRRLRDAGKPTIWVFLPGLIWPGQFILPILSAIAVSHIVDSLNVADVWQSFTVVGTALATWLAFVLIGLPRHKRWWHRLMNAPSISL